MDRRNFLRAAGVVPIALTIPVITSAQADDEKPNFEVAGRVQTDPPGYEVAWSSLWSQRELDGLTFEVVPGTTGFIVLDTEERATGVSNLSMGQRIVIETNAANKVIDAEELMNSFEDLHPATHMGYAPGTVIESRHVTDQGCWFSFGPGPNGGGIEGVVGLSLYYTPEVAGDPLLNVMFNLALGSFRTPEFLEEMDSTVSLNGNWLLGMDDLGNFWEALETSYGWDD